MPRPVLVGAFLAATLLVVGVVLVAVLGPRVDERTALASAPGPAASPVAVPAADVQGVHDALHDIDARCRPGRAGGNEIERDADVILRFAERYPDATFPIDDETGRTASLLTTARQGVQVCATATADRIDRVLPPRYRLRPTGPP